MVKVFILAGGLGTRMLPWSHVLPKSLLPVKYKPCVRWIIDELYTQGFKDVTLCVNRNFSKLFQYSFRDLPLKFSITEKPQGTAGEISSALRTQTHFVDDCLLVIYGDDITKMDYKDFIDFHRKEKADVSLALTTNVPLDVGVVDLEGNKITGFKEKPHINVPTWTGRIIFNKEVLNYLTPHKDIAKDVIPQMLADKKRIYGYLTHNRWLDVGNYQHYVRTQKEIQFVQKGKTMTGRFR